MQFLLQFFLTATALIVIILVMLQRGKGGGLAGALGGMGGQSAFGTKAGDLFTKITVGVATVWIFISIFAAIYAPYMSGVQISGTQSAPQNPGQAPSVPDAGKPADSAAGKADKSGKTAAPSATEKGAKGSESVGKPVEKSPTPPAAPSPTAPAK